MRVLLAIETDNKDLTPDLIANQVQRVLGEHYVGVELVSPYVQYFDKDTVSHLIELTQQFDFLIGRMNDSVNTLPIMEELLKKIMEAAK